MTERPIIFSGPMVRAIIDGRKTQTRRIVNPQPAEWIESFGFSMFTPDGHISGRGNYKDKGPAEKFYKLPYKVKDRLWVRETCWFDPIDDYLWTPNPTVVYRADGDVHFEKGHGWTPSIHMPKWAARIWLEVTGVRVERLQDISEEDAIAEGCRPYFDHENPDIVTGPNGSQTPMAPLMGPLDDFKRLWDSLNAKRAPWASNPWVWVIEFRRMND